MPLQELSFDSGLDYDQLDLVLDPSLIDTANDVVSLPADTDDPAPGRSGAGAHKPYYPKKPHRKSRAGCKQCKKRKVKCDESKPVCKACSLRQESCVYDVSDAKPSPSNAASRSPRESSPSDWELDRISVPVVEQPFYMGCQGDAGDMRMLWFYTTYAFQAFSMKSNRSAAVDFTLKVKVMEHAFKSPFLMDTIMAMSGLHLAELNQPIPSRRLVNYQTRSFEGYRSAIERADPKDYPALLACSLFMIAVSSQNFRGPNRKRLFITEWISIWRGIGLIVQLISPQAVKQSGLAILFYRPPVDLERAARCIPSNLLFMVQSIQPGDPDWEFKTDYYSCLKTLGSLYQELQDRGFGPIMDIRGTTFFSFMPRSLIQLGRENRPRILVIIAYWICFIKIRGTADAKSGWWLTGLQPTMYDIFDELGENWEHLLHIPRAVMQTDDRVEVARLLLGNPEWGSHEKDSYVKHGDPRTETGLTMCNNTHQEVDLTRNRLTMPERPEVSVSPKTISGIDLASRDFLLGSSLVYNPSKRPPPYRDSLPSEPTPEHT